MTHSTVTVCIPPAYKDDAEERVRTLLEPFDENDRRIARRDYIDGDPADYWSVKGLREDGKLPGEDSLSWQLVADAHNEKYRPANLDAGDTDCDSIFLDREGRPYSWTTYPEDVERDGGIIAGARWDWWQIGGRWTGYFDVKSEAVGSPELINGRPGLMGSVNTDLTKCDGGPRRLLDFDAMRQRAEQKAETEWKAFHLAIAEHPDTKGWSSFVARSRDEEGYTIDQARIDYRDQPGWKALEATQFGMWNCPIDHFSAPMEKFVERAVAGAVPGYALLDLDRVWREPGRMGWWAMSDETEKSKTEYHAMANEYLDNLDPDTILVVVDVHI